MGQSAYSIAMQQMKELIEKANLGQVSFDKAIEPFKEQLAEKASIAALTETNEEVAKKADQTALDETNENLALKANITYVDTQLSNIGNGSPKGTYATLTALQAAFPTGTPGIYIVTENGNWYYWNGTAWTSGGVYQSTGLADKSVAEKNLTTALLSKYSNKFSDVATIVDKEVIQREVITLPYEVSLNSNSKNLFTPSLFDGAICSVPSTNPRVVILDPDTFKIESDGIGSTADVNVTYRFDMQLEPNTSYYFKSTNIVKYTEYGTTVGVGNFYIIGDSVSLMLATDNNTKIFTTGASGLVTIGINIQNAKTPVGVTQEVTISSVMFAKSTVSLPYERYEPPVNKGVVSLDLESPNTSYGELTVVSKNIFTPKLFDNAVSSVPSVNARVSVINDDKFIVLSDGIGSSSDVNVTYSIFGLQLEPNTSYYFKSTNTVKYTGYGTAPGLGAFSIIGDGVLLLGPNDNNTKVFTTGASGKVDIKLNIQNAMTPVGITQEITVVNCILAKSTSVLPYTRYHDSYKEFIPAFSGNYKTVISVSNGDTINVSSVISKAILETYGEKSDEPVPASPKKLVCFGDSITGVFAAPTDYPSKIAEKTGLTVYNVGFGGCRMGQHPTPRYDAFCMYRLADAVTTGDFSRQDADTSGAPSFPERLATLKSIDWSTVDYVTIAYGTNDWGGGHSPNKPIDNPDDPFAVNNYYGATRYALRALLNTFPHLKIMLISPYYRFDYATGQDIDSDNWFPEYNPGIHLIQYVDALQSVGVEFKIPALDMIRSLGINKYNREHYFDGTDGTHPNETGRDLIACRIAGQLEALFYVK